jgi:hypothetical protein
MIFFYDVYYVHYVSNVVPAMVVMVVESRFAVPEVPEAWPIVAADVLPPEFP